MGTIIALAVVATAIILTFLDQIIAQIYPKGVLSGADESCHEMFDDGDCLRIHSKE